MLPCVLYNLKAALSEILRAILLYRNRHSEIRIGNNKICVRLNNPEHLLTNFNLVILAKNSKIIWTVYTVHFYTQTNTNNIFNILHTIHCRSLILLNVDMWTVITDVSMNNLKYWYAFWTLLKFNLTYN